MERGRTEFLRDIGVHHSELVKEGIAFAVRSMQLDFLAAAHIDDLLTVITEVAGKTGVRLTLSQRILRGDDMLVTAEVVVVAIKDGKATRLPQGVLKIE